MTRCDGSNMEKQKEGTFERSLFVAESICDRVYFVTLAATITISGFS